jgi:S-formylglutathione hydrolase FrmB
MLGRVIILWSCFLLSSQTLIHGDEASADVASVSKVADRIEHVTFASDVLKTSKRFCVVLPKNYTTNQADWPVLYLLHGRGRTERSLVDDEVARAALLNAPFVIVLPAGEDGWYVDSPADPKQKYDRLLTETIRAAESKYRLSRDPKHRAIAGWSMGGYGATQYAVTHPAEFAIVASIIGLVDFPRSGLPEGQSYEVPTKVFGDERASWPRLNPINSVEKLRGTSVLIIAASDAFDRTMNENFRERLRQSKVDHEWIMLQGTHHFDVVKQSLPFVIDRVQKKIVVAKSSQSNHTLANP